MTRVARTLSIGLAMMIIALVASGAAPTTSPTVGIEKRFEVDVQGPRLETKPAAKNAKLLLRIASATPVAGERIRYDFRYMGFVPGAYDLREYVARSDGSALGDIPPMSVYVEKLLPDDYAGDLIAAAAAKRSTFGGYKRLAWIVGVIWVLLLVPLVFVRRAKAKLIAVEAARPLTLADRLKPMIERAARGELSITEKAELERLLLGHWREALSLKDDPAKAIASMRRHPQAGRLLRALEEWLHRPPTADARDHSIAALLEPYRTLGTPLSGASAT